MATFKKELQSVQEEESSEDIDEDVKVIPMEEDDFNDPEENKNEFKTPMFTSEWLENEKYTFKKIRDKNGDGYLGTV